MKEIIFIRYSELTLKGKNRNEFAKVLFSNIKNKLKGIEYESIKREYDYIEIVPGSNSDEIMNRLKYVIGISWFTKAYVIKSDKEAIKELILDKLDRNKETFRVSAKNRSELFENSDELTRFLATVVLKNTDLKVNLKNHDIELNVKVTDETTTIHLEKVKGIEGLPVGSNGRGLVFLSGGIDSPVAAFEMMTRGVAVDFITFLNPITSTENVMKKVTSLSKQVTLFAGNHTRHYIVDFKLVQGHIAKELKYEEYRTTFLRRAFAKYGEYLANEYGYQTLITGDALGQVASQTLENLNVIDEASKLLMSRPLLGRDKNSIIKISKQIGTHDFSIMPGDDMCSDFTPRKPILKPKFDKTIAIANEVENYDDLFAETKDNLMEVIKVENV